MPRLKTSLLNMRRVSPQDSGVDMTALQSQLSAIAEQGGSNLRGQVLDVFKAALNAAMEDAKELFEHGRLGGLEMARMIAAIHDDIIIALFDFTTTHIVYAANPTRAEKMSLCAVGGYGRGEMAPCSDVDLLFLTADKKGSAHTEAVTEYMLYMLWDMGLKVGHATRTIEQCIKLSKEDQTILTALLDLRYLCGDLDLADALYQKFQKQIKRGSGRKYIASKLAERDIRHEREGNSRYVIEPNIKEGKGGLRDLHVLYWIANFLDHQGQITDPQLAKNYVGMGLFDEHAAMRFTRAADFLWRTRIWLHFIAGRATETLSFDQQVKLCRKMGYASGPVEVAVEGFMREYFTNAREVGALTRIACAKLEAEKNIRLPKGLDSLLPGSRKNLKNTQLIIDHGRLNFADPMTIRDDPSVIMQLFETAGRRNLDIHPDAFSAIDFRRNLIDADFRRDPNNAKIFQKLLLSAKAPYATLRIMNEAGVLGRYLTEFGGIVSRTQFNMHHAYTVDEHTLRLVFYLDDLRKGRMEETHPIVTKVIKAFDDQDMLTLYLACLLHDTGKGQGDQCIEGAQLARRACRRLGVSQDMTEDVAWLVRRHLDMSETAQRRDISDPQTIKDFGELVGSVRRLELLTALTVVDIHSVGPGIWNEWKAVLLRGLFHATAGFLDGREELAPKAKARAMEEQLTEKLPPDMAVQIQPVLDSLPDNYWFNFDMADMLRHARFFSASIEAGGSTAVNTRINRTRNVTELWILTQDRPGLFTDLTLAMSACGASITGARLHTQEDPANGSAAQVMNVFYLHAIEGMAFGEDNPQLLTTLKRLCETAAVEGAVNISIPKAVGSKRAGAIPVQPKVSFPKSTSEQSTIIEIQGRDRPGLLHALAQIFQTAGLNILSAHIEVVGATAIDSFYIQDARTGALSPAKRKAIKADILTVLGKTKVKGAAA